MNTDWYPHVTVAAICERQGQYLLVEEFSKSSGKHVINQPAGHIEDNESVIQAVIRETLEETCRHFTPTALLGLYRYRTDRNQTYFRYAIIGDVSEIDTNVTRDSDIIDTHWRSLNEISEMPNLRSSMVLTCLQDYDNGLRYPLDIIRD